MNGISTSGMVSHRSPASPARASRRTSRGSPQRSSRPLRRHPRRRPRRRGRIGSCARSPPTSHIEEHCFPTGKNAGRVVLKLSGCDSISAAEALAGQQLFIARSELPALDPGTFFVGDLLGCTIYDVTPHNAAGEPWAPSPTSSSPRRPTAGPAWKTPLRCSPCNLPQPPAPARTDPGAVRPRLDRHHRHRRPPHHHAPPRKACSKLRTTCALPRAPTPPNRFLGSRGETLRSSLRPLRESPGSPPSSHKAIH